MTESEQTDVDLLAALARGVVELAETSRSSAFGLPYPTEVQLALDRWVLAALTRGESPPVGVPQLMTWCRQPRLGGRLALPADFLFADACLIDPVADEPTQTCAELGSFGRHGVVEQEAETLLAGLVEACAGAERFAKCRDFLIRRPVLLRLDPMELMQPSVAQVWNLVKGFYGPVPARFSADDAVHVCSGCGLLAKPFGKEAPWCEGNCPPDGRGFVTSHDPRLARAIPFALRLFLALPGRTEQAVRAVLAERVSLLPSGLGVNRAVALDGGPRLFQCHHREQPGPAALRAAETAALLGAPLDIVVPDRVAERPGYRASFEVTLPEGAPVRIFSATEFTSAGSSRRERRSHA
ncbi:pPIWI_RE_Y domain-containing protein [Streptomyces bacillaris]|uniref:pPIWI_RE_Y domain-containing protein n=1 Tax=Streptomyces bacillaris TaxID=68179 RepID=UPI0037F193B6